MGNRIPLESSASKSFLRSMDEDSGERDHGVNGDDDLVVVEWVEGLPSGDDLVPLSQLLVSPELASAFSIPPADLKTMADIHRAAQHSTYLKADQKKKKNPMESSSAPENDIVAPIAALAEGDSSSLNPAEEENCTGRMLKRARLVWTPQLHKRFVDVVARLGIKNAVPKTIMQLMNVDGLTRENVASHLQKYRLYLKRMQGLSPNEEEGPASSSDHLFASTPPLPVLPQKILYEQQQIAMPYAVPTMIPMQVYSIPHHHAHGVVPVNINHPPRPPGNFCKPFDHPLIQPYAAPNDCSGGSKFASIVSNPPHVSPGTREKHKK